MRATARPFRVRPRAPAPRRFPFCPGRAATPRWRALVVAVLLAFSWQAVVVQAHVHQPARQDVSARGAGYAAAVLHPADGGHRHEPPASCPICREMAHAGHFVLPAPVALFLPAPADAWLAARIPPAWTRPSRSHGWRSRGPPVPLPTRRA